MDIRIFLYAFGVWIIFGILTVINGVIRNRFYEPVIGEYAAHVISTVIAICFVVVGTYLFIRFIGIEYSNAELLLIGVFWLILTVLFEFIFGHYVVGNSWERLLADYNILEGRVWSLFLLTALVSPLLISMLLKRGM